MYVCMYSMRRKRHFMGEWRYWAALDATRIMDVTGKNGGYIYTKEIFFKTSNVFSKTASRSRLTDL